MVEFKIWLISTKYLIKIVKLMHVEYFADNIPESRSFYTFDQDGGTW